MKVTLKSFRKHEEKVFAFSELSLIKGTSGQGKSTVFYAIYWCLFGSLKCVYPFSDNSATTEVILEMGNFYVKRSRNPRYIKVTLENKEYKDAEAQSVINVLFGEKSTWLATSFLEQGQLHTLLSGSTASSMELLNNLAFSREQPREFLSKLNSTYKEKEIFVLNLRKNLEKTIEELEPLLPDYKEKNRKSTDELKELRNKVLGNKEEITKLSYLVLKERENVGLRKALQEEEKTLQNKLDELPDCEGNIKELVEKENTLKKEKEKAYSYESTKQHHDNLQAKIKQLQAKTKKIPNEDLLALKENIYKYNKHHETADKFKIAYDEKIIKEEIKTLEEAIFLAQKNAALYSVQKEQEKKKKEIEKSLQMLGDKREFDRKKLQEELTVCKEEEKRILESNKVLSCPECKANLRYDGDKLDVFRGIISKGNISEIRNKIVSLNKEISSCEKEEDKERQRENLRKQLDNISYTTVKNVVAENTIKSWRTKQLSLSGIEVLPKPEYTKEDISIFLEIEKCKNSLPSLTNKEERSSTEINLELNALQQNIKNLQERTNLNKRLTDVKNRLRGIPETTCEQELITLSEKTSHLEKEICLAEKSNKIHEKYTSYEKERKEYEGGYEDLVSLQKLKHNALQAECMHLDNVINTCNYVLDKVCSRIFEEPLSAKLCLLKQLKNGNNAHKVNFILNYKGREGDVEQLSGGEKQRLSLALTLALSQFSDSPILLDECLAFLDADLQESCLEAMREFCSNKIVLYIGHNMVEGYFDRTIQL